MYKDDWNEAYEDGIEQGMDEDTAAQYADDKAYDIMAEIADMAWLRDKYGEQV